MCVREMEEEWSKERERERERERESSEMGKPIESK